MDTVGDAYVVTGFLPAPTAHPGHSAPINEGGGCEGLGSKAAMVCKSMLRMGEVILTELAAYRRETGEAVHGRVGIAVGPVVVGALGRLQPRIHALGAGMRAADVLEQTGRAGAVHVSEDFMRLLLIAGVEPPAVAPVAAPAAPPRALVRRLSAAVLSLTTAGKAQPTRRSSDGTGATPGASIASASFPPTPKAAAAALRRNVSEGRTRIEGWRAPVGWLIQESRLHHQCPSTGADNSPHSSSADSDEDVTSEPWVGPRLPNYTSGGAVISLLSRGDDGPGSGCGECDDSDHSRHPTPARANEASLTPRSGAASAVQSDMETSPPPHSPQQPSPPPSLSGSEAPVQLWGWTSFVLVPAQPLYDSEPVPRSLPLSRVGRRPPMPRRSPARLARIPS